MNFKCTNSSIKEELNQTRTVISELGYPHIKLIEQMSRVHLGQLHMIMHQAPSPWRWHNQLSSPSKIFFPSFILIVKQSIFLNNYCECPEAEAGRLNLNLCWTTHVSSTTRKHTLESMHLKKDPNSTISSLLFY